MVRDAVLRTAPHHEVPGSAARPNRDPPPPQFGTPDFHSPTISLIVFATMWVLAFLGTAALLHFLLSFPSPVRLLARPWGTMILYGPVVSMIHFDKCLWLYGGGTFNGENNGTGSHFVLIIGWDDKKSAWLVKNSFGMHHRFAAVVANRPYQSLGQHCDQAGRRANSKPPRLSIRAVQLRVERQ